MYTVIISCRVPLPGAWELTVTGCSKDTWPWKSEAQKGGTPKGLAVEGTGSEAQVILC
jgi:hypothetical protein